jgi:hypothetical protein
MNGTVTTIIANTAGCLSRSRSLTPVVRAGAMPRCTAGTSGVTCCSTPTSAARTNGNAVLNGIEQRLGLQLTLVFGHTFLP